jgi:hypothetical protein
VNVPLSHAAHTDAAVELLNEPGEQSEQSCAAPALKRPTTHAEHTVAPRVLTYPGSHGEQEPSTAYWPPAHRNVPSGHAPREQL